MLLATDLDGTFLGGKSIFKQQLYQLVRSRNDIQLVFVTGRGLESVIPLLNDPIVPNPDFIIADVGATVVDGRSLEPVEPLQKQIESKWPGQLKILNTIKDIHDLKYQEVPQQRRCSFYVSDQTVVREVQSRMTDLGCEIIYSAGKFLDVLSQGVNKGSSLCKLVEYLEVDKRLVLVAGDTLNDLEMYQHGFKGVVVGNAEHNLKISARETKNVYFAKAEGAGGVLEAMRYFNFIDLERDIPNRLRKTNTDIPQLVMLYHRFPYELKEIDGKMERVAPKSPNGILPTLQGFFSNGRPGIWIAWEEVKKKGEKLRNIYIDEEVYPNLIASRIGLTKSEIVVFYELFSKEAFWPTIFAFADKVKFNHEHWDHFVAINRMFAEKAAEQADHAALVWIHDYNLWLVPGFLKQLRPDLKIAFFHHTAFPAANTFNILPWRREIIGSLLKCDFIGFHIPRYVENFVDVVNSLFPIKEVEKISCAPRFLTFSSAIGVSQVTRSISVGDRQVNLGAVPVGINVAYIDELFKDGDLLSKIAKMKQGMNGKKMIISAERLDYVKGPLEKILAFESFLEQHPEFHGKIELVNICTPPAEGMKIYDSIKLDLEQALGRINGKYSEMNWTPLRIFFRSIPFEEILVYYGVADVAWITPLRDGLNLVAKEYVAVQGKCSGEKGVLILSEFAGAAVELQYAVLTNPYDAKSLKESLWQALQMKPEERQMRMERLHDQIQYYDIDYWARDFMAQAFNYDGIKNHENNSTLNDRITIEKESCL